MSIFNVSNLASLKGFDKHDRELIEDIINMEIIPIPRYHCPYEGDHTIKGEEDADSNSF